MAEEEKKPYIHTHGTFFKPDGLELAIGEEFDLNADQAEAFKSHFKPKAIWKAEQAEAQIKLAALAAEQAAYEEAEAKRRADDAAAADAAKAAADKAAKDAAAAADNPVAPAAPVKTATA